MSKAVYKIVTDRIIAQLEKGVIPWQMPWMRDQKAPMNLLSRKPYQGVNAMMTGCMGYRSPFWLTYKQATGMGGQVRKGEKGTPIVFWKFLEKEDDKGKKKKIPLLRYFTVFNVEQVEGIDQSGLYPENKAIDFKPIEKAEEIVKASQCKPRIQHVEQKAYYSPVLDYINMPVPESFRTPEEYYSTLFHELAHATGHKERLNRKTLAEIAHFGDHSYSKEELVAEMGSAYLCAITGISDPVIENQAAYIQGWLKKLKNDPAMVVQAASQAQKAADYIIGNNVQEGEGTEAA